MYGLEVTIEFISSLYRLIKINENFFSTSPIGLCAPLGTNEMFKSGTEMFHM